jgi:hypothetical protein
MYVLLPIKITLYAKYDTTKLYFTVNVSIFCWFREALWEIYDDVYTEGGTDQRIRVIQNYLDNL